MRRNSSEEHRPPRVSVPRRGHASGSWPCTTGRAASLWRSAGPTMPSEHAVSHPRLATGAAAPAVARVVAAAFGRAASFPRHPKYKMSAEQQYMKDAADKRLADNVKK